MRVETSYRDRLTMDTDRLTRMIECAMAGPKHQLHSYLEQMSRAGQTELEQLARWLVEAKRPDLCVVKEASFRFFIELCRGVTAGSVNQKGSWGSRNDRVRLVGDFPTADALDRLIRIAGLPRSFGEDQQGPLSLFKNRDGGGCDVNRLFVCAVDPEIRDFVQGGKIPNWQHLGLGCQADIAHALLTALVTGVLNVEASSQVAVYENLGRSIGAMVPSLVRDWFYRCGFTALIPLSDDLSSADLQRIARYWGHAAWLLGKRGIPLTDVDALQFAYYWCNGVAARVPGGTLLEDVETYLTTTSNVVRHGIRDAHQMNEHDVDPNDAFGPPYAAFQGALYRRHREVASGPEPRPPFVEPDCLPQLTVEECLA